MRAPSRISVVTLVASAAALVLAPATTVQAQKKPSLSEVPLSVTIQSTDSAGTPMQTTGDRDPDASVYVHGDEEVYAVINKTGGLTIDFQPAASSPRSVFFSYATGDGRAPDPGTTVYSGLRTHLASTNTPLQNMAIPGTQCIPLGTAFTYSDGTSYRHSYQATNIASVDTTATAFGQVTRLDENTWLIESRDGLCNSVGRAHVAKLIKGTTVRNRTTYTDEGAFVMGFSMLLVRK